MAYDGQSGRNGYIRGKEHADKASSTCPKALAKSVIHNHEKDCHDSQKMKWEMKVIRRFPKKPLDRLIFESLRILARELSMSLNSKTELAKCELMLFQFTQTKIKRRENSLQPKTQ